uniref:HAT C-terminal dimerisation domain-containing protein n=2 Tax=Gopherus TaxID=38771 RepID=A0A8C4Y930_9SAUR
MDEGEGSSKRNSSEGSVKKKKYYCCYNDNWCKDPDYKNWLRKVDEFTAECILCRQTFSIKYEGRRAVNIHAECTKHKEAVKNQKRTPQIAPFFTKKDAPQVNLVTAAEIGEIYHGVVHHLSYASQCGNNMLPRFLPDSEIARKMSCGRTKATSITENVLAPKSQELLLNDLELAGFFSVGSDASNKGNRKFFPITVRYFSKTEGIKYGLLDFYRDNDETSEAIAARISNIIEENGLNINCVSSYVADNASVNFEKHRSVYQKLKQLNDRIIEVGCKCHVIHNCIKNGMKALSFDVESLVLKVYSEFSSSAKKSESLCSFFEFVEIEYKEILHHVPTRWLSLLPAIEQVLQCWPALKAYFISEGEEECVKIVWEAFSEDEQESLPLCYVYFLHNLMGVFYEALKKLECNNASCTELDCVMESLHSKLKRRKEDNFYGRSVQAILCNVSPSNKRKFKEEADKAFSRCIAYLEKWYDFKTSVFKQMSVLSLDNEVKWSDLEKLAEVLRIEIDFDKLFDDYCVLQQVRREIISKEQKIDQRWVEVFKQIPESGNSQMFKLVSFTLSIPVSNAYCERVFSLMTQLWSKERNRLSESVVKAELQVQLNYSMSCTDFYEYVKKSPELLKAARSQLKYRFKKKNSEQRHSATGNPASIMLLPSLTC